VCSMEVTPALLSGAGAVHGGAVASLIDHALALAVYPLVEPDRWVATTEFKVNYLGWVEKGRITATGRVLSLGRQIAVGRVDVENEGRAVAAAQGTLYVRERIKKP
jgi:1,4-dihydroxy-2-naphthoyl-CoA hydrolase